MRKIVFPILICLAYTLLFSNTLTLKYIENLELSEAKKVINQMTDVKELIDIVINLKNWEIQKYAFRKISDNNSLVLFVNKCGKSEVLFKYDALKLLAEQNTKEELIEIATKINYDQNLKLFLSYALLEDPLKGPFYTEFKESNLDDSGLIQIVNRSKYDFTKYVAMAFFKERGIEVQKMYADIAKKTPVKDIYNTPQMIMHRSVSSLLPIIKNQPLLFDIKNNAELRQVRKEARANLIFMLGLKEYLKLDMPNKSFYLVLVLIFLGCLFAVILHYLIIESNNFELDYILISIKYNYLTLFMISFLFFLVLSLTTYYFTDYYFRDREKIFLVLTLCIGIYNLLIVFFRLITKKYVDFLEILKDYFLTCSTIPLAITGFSGYKLLSDHLGVTQNKTIQYLFLFIIFYFFLLIIKNLVLYRNRYFEYIKGFFKTKADDTNLTYQPDEIQPMSPEELESLLWDFNYDDSDRLNALNQINDQNVLIKFLSSHLYRLESLKICIEVAKKITDQNQITEILIDDYFDPDIIHQKQVDFYEDAGMVEWPEGMARDQKQMKVIFELLMEKVSNSELLEKISNDSAYEIARKKAKKIKND